MKKLLLAFVIIFTSVYTGQAQVQAKYHSELDLGYSIGIGTFSTGRVNLQMIQGVKIGQYFSTGLGLGLDCYHEFYEVGEWMIPIFINAKGYLPMDDDKTSVYASFDIGVGAGLTGGVKGMAGILCTPAVGIRYSMFKAQLGYNFQRVSEYGINIDMSAIQIKIGLIF